MVENSSQLFLERLKSNYDWIKSLEETFLDSELRYLSTSSAKSLPVGTALSQLLINGFDAEQIWQQLQLQNIEKMRLFPKYLCEYSQDRRYAAVRIFQNSVKSDVEENEENHNLEDSQRNIAYCLDALGYQDAEEEGLSDSGSRLSVTREEKRMSEVDDKFFCLKDMEEFLEIEDEKERKKYSGVEELDFKDEDVDYFEHQDADDSPGNLCYSDFFDAAVDGHGTTWKGKWVDGNGVDDDFATQSATTPREEVPEAKSRLEERDRELRERIFAFEEENLAPKSWQMVGEISGQKRPENALLEEHLTYDNAAKFPPVITKDTTEKLEQLIKQRILDKAWDDVERKAKPSQEPQRYRNELVLDQEKSKLSLSQIYEKEFVKQTEKEEIKIANPKHEEIKKELEELFNKLDALSSYHYAPKTAVPEVRIVKNVRSLNMEEVAPVTANSASLLAPEEIKSAATGELKANSERTKKDKKRERRKTKEVKRKRIKMQQEREAGNIAKNKLKALQKIGRVRKPKVVSQGKNKTVTSNDFFNEVQKKNDCRKKSSLKGTEMGKKYKL